MSNKLKDLRQTIRRDSDLELIALTAEVVALKEQLAAREAVIANIKAITELHFTTINGGRNDRSQEHERG